MRKLLIAAVLVLAVAMPAVLQADVKVGMALNEQGLNSFYIALSDYNKVQQQNVVAVKNQGIPDEELPVVFYMSSKAKVPYNDIVKLRLKKWNWAKIAVKYKIDPTILNVPIKGQVRGNVYGRLYKNLQANPKAGWNELNVKDDDVVNSVNLRLLSDYYGYSPEEVIRLREQGRDFVTINNEVKTIRVKKGWRPTYDFRNGKTDAENFYIALAEYNMLRPWEIAQVSKLGISDEELPVVFFIAANAGVPYGDVVKLRLKNWGWMKIALKYGLDPAAFYVGVNEKLTGVVYGRTYGYFDQYPQERWNRIKLSDDDVINLVNLRFVTDYYGYAPEEVIRLRESGRDFIEINNKVNVIIAKRGWGQKDKQFREKHGRDYKYDYNQFKANGNIGQDSGNQGRQDSNYKDLDEKNYNKGGRDANVRDNGSQNNNQQGTNNQGWNNNKQKKQGRGWQQGNNNAPVSQVTAAQAGSQAITVVVTATPVPVVAQATAVPVVVQVTATPGQDQGGGDKWNKDKGNNGVRNHGVGNDNGVGNQKHDNQ